MIRYEYKVIPAPLRGVKGKGIKGPEGRFANALEQAMNDMAADGWDYQRAETLPSEERAGLTGKNTVFRNVLVFRRAIEDAAETEDAKLLAPPSEEEQADVAEDPQIEEADSVPSTEAEDPQIEEADSAPSTEAEADPEEAAEHEETHEDTEETR